MRTKRSGIAIPSYARPQVFDKEQLPFWRRMTELHLQLNPYLRAADDEHRASGLPIARHLVLAWPHLERAQDSSDQYLLGPDLLAAPVTAPGRRERRVWLPPGRWVDWWRSVRFEEPSGAYRLGRLRVLRGQPRRDAARALGEPPLLMRAGALLPLLGADVDTLVAVRPRGRARPPRRSGGPAAAGRRPPGPL